MKYLGFVLCLALSACCCLDKPAPPLQDPLSPEPKASEVTHRILAYGDTRTGVFLFESQANFGEQVHDWVASQMVERLGKEKAPIIFTGDAVYAGGATFHYDNFVKAVTRFKNAGLPFYPCVGNHEIMAGILGVISPWFESGNEPSNEITQTDSLEGKQVKQFIWDRENELKKVHGHRENLSKEVIDRIDAQSEALDDKILPKVEDQAKSKSAEDRISTAQHVMEALYVKKAKFSYLKQVFSVDKHTYYSIELAKSGPSILGIMLDTNSLDYIPQKQWFLDLLKTSKHDLIIVFGHHPPHTIEGWDADYIGALNEHKHAVLWVMSHVHAFTYALPESSPSIPTRAILVSGGGGAPLVNSDERTSPIKGWKYFPPNDDSGKFFHFLDIRTTKESVYVTVVGCSKQGEPMVPKATYQIKLPQK